MNLLKYFSMKAALATLVFLVAITNLKAQDPTYLCELRNDVQVDARTFEFDIYLLRTGSVEFEFASMQFGININSGALNGGAITVYLVSGTSELNASQIPPANKFSFNSTANCIIMTGTAPPGAGNGTIISNSGNGTRLGRIRLVNTVDFGSVTPDLTWSFALANGYITKVNAYVGGLAKEITVQASHTTSNLSNNLLNPPAPVQYTVTGGGSYCEGGSGVAVGLSGSEVGVTYTLLRGGVDLAPTVAGTGSAISFGNQTVAGTYTVEGTNAGGTTTMTGSAIVTVDPLPVAAGTISGTASVCQEVTGVSYTVATITNATSYQWVYSGTGATIDGTSNSVTISFASNATSGNLTVRGVNSCGTGTYSPAYAITVNSVPGAAGTITGTSTVCQGQSGVSYSVPVISGATNYLWSYSGTGASISGSSNSVTITFSTGAISGNLTVRGENSCGSGTVSSAYSITVNELPTVNAGTDASIPNGTSTTLSGSVTGTGPFTYSWTPAASVTNPTSLSTSTVNLSTTTTFTLTATSTSTGCSNSDQVTITITGGSLGASATATPGTICAGSSTQLAANASGGSGTYTYSWTSNPAGFTSSSASPTASPTENTTYTVTVDDGFSKTDSQVTVTVNAVPAAPTVGQITHPTCTVSTGSVVLSGLPSGSWTINPGNRTGSTTSTTITGLTPGSYTFTVTNSSGCTSPASSEVVINTQPAVPSRPVVGTVTQPTCALATGSVELSGLPSTGTWTLRQYPGGTTSTGTGTTVTVTSLPQGTYNFSVENEGGCVSLLSDNVVINAQPPTPSAPVVGTITHPTYTVSTGSVVLNGLPSGTWTLTRYPDEVETTGTGASRTITGLEPGTYSFTVTNSVGCTSASSADVVINPRPGTPDLFITNPATICSNETVDLTLPAVTAGSDEDLTFTYWTDLMATVAYATPTAAPPGIYYIKGTNPLDFYAIKQVVVTADELPVPNAGPDKVLEYVFGTTLEADIPLAGTGLWALESGTGQIFNSSAPSTAVSGLSIGDNIFSWTITNGACDPVSDYITIRVNNLIIPTLITPNQDGRNDFFEIRGLETMGRTELFIFDRRGLKVYENHDYDNIDNRWEGLDYNSNPLPDDTYFYVIRSDNGISLSGYIVVRR